MNSRNCVNMERARIVRKPSVKVIVRESKKRVCGVLTYLGRRQYSSSMCLV